MSRRLTISSLLCDDDDNDGKPPAPTVIVPDPVVLAPHLRKSPQRVQLDLSRNSAQTSASSSSRVGLDALVHAASAVAAAEERSRLPASSPTSTWSAPGTTADEPYTHRSNSLSPLHDLKLRTTNTLPSHSNYAYSRPSSSHSQHERDSELLQYQHRQQQQLDQRHVHREQILGYNDHHHRHSRKSDPLPGPGMRSILSPTMSSSMPAPAYNPLSSPSSYPANHAPLPSSSRSSPHMSSHQLHSSLPSHASSRFIHPPSEDEERFNKRRRYSDVPQDERMLDLQREQHAKEYERLELEHARHKQGQEEEMERYRRKEEERQRHRKEAEDMSRHRSRMSMGSAPISSPSLAAITSPVHSNASPPLSRSSIAALNSPNVASISTSPSLSVRRAGAGYDPVHENDRQSGPALNSRPTSHWDRVNSPTQQYQPTPYGLTRPQRTLEVIEIPERDPETPGVEDRTSASKRVRTGHREPPPQSPYPPVPRESHNQPSRSQAQVNRSQTQSTHAYHRDTLPATLHSPNISHEPRLDPNHDTQAHHRFAHPREAHPVSSSAAAHRSPHLPHDAVRDSDNHVSHSQRDFGRDSHLSPIPRDSFDNPQVPRIPQPPTHAPHHRVISPPGRRSPPGSQAGRAIAAKKVEMELQQQIPRMESVMGRQGARPTAGVANEEVKVKREASVVPSVSKVDASAMDQELEKEREANKKKEMRQSRTEVPQRSSSLTLGGIKPESITPKPPSPSPPPALATSAALQKSTPRQIVPPPSLADARREEDPHEWLLEHYANEDRRKGRRPPSSAVPASVPPEVNRSESKRRSTTSPVARPQTKSPVVPSAVESGQSGKDGDDAMMALEQELDAELAQVAVDDVDKKPSYPDAMDVDVDQAVAELVDETLGAGSEADSSVQHVPEDEGESEVEPAGEGEEGEGEPEIERKDDDDDKAMDVDVEDELLSLVDDHPNSRMSPSTHTARPAVPTETKGKGSKAKTPAPSASKLKKEESASRPSSPFTLSAFRSSSTGAARPSSVKPSEKDDRESMPPPATTDKAELSTSSAPQAKKKGKPGPKPKPRNPDGTIVGAPPPPPLKPRGKPGPKPKPRDEFGNIIRAPAVTAPATAPSKVGRANSSTTPAPQLSRAPSGSNSKDSAVRSRSTSAHPAGSVGPEGDGQAKEDEEKSEEKDEDDDKLYCLCRTLYEEDKPMIACDSCDEWYHMKCVEIPEHKGDLVDQFFCPMCISKEPSLDLQTTYKTRCLFGLNSPDPDSPKACHKPARTFSKYCSEGCGVKNLRKRVDTFTKKGGRKEDLWETVKTATKREGLVRVVAESIPMEVDGAENTIVKPVVQEIKLTKTRQEREIERLNGLLGDIERIRDELRRGMDIILSREKLLQLASDRAEYLKQCGWDQRLCFSEDDWADYGDGIFESYADLDQLAENPNEEEGEWWCPGEQECERHAGWQDLRARDVDKEKAKKEEALYKLTTREREIRKRIDRMVEEDIGPLLGGTPRRAPGQKGSNKLSNGHATKKVNGDASKKGKKRKAPS